MSGVTLGLRSYHWFFALIASALAHGWLIYSLQLFQQEAVEVEREALPFTVLLADQEVVEELVLEQPEALSSEEIPLVSLDEAEQSMVESDLGVTVDLSVDGDSLELMSEAELEVASAQQVELATAPEVVLDTPSKSPVIRPVESEMVQTESRAVIAELGESETIQAADETVIAGIGESDPLEVESAAIPELSNVAVLSPEQFAELQQPEAPLVTEVSLEMLPEPELIEDRVESAALEVDSLSVALESPLQEEITLPLDAAALQGSGMLPEVNRHSEVMMAEITVEQIEFDEAVMRTLPQVTAQEWRPDLPSAEGVTASQGGGWRGRYRGATGISARYRKTMRTTLTQFVLYPKAVAEEMKIEGKVVIGFTINRQGRLEDTEVLESSGHPALDRAVEKMIEFAQPFSALPKQVKSDKVRFAFPVTIKLKK